MSLFEFASLFLLVCLAWIWTQYRKASNKSKRLEGQYAALREKYQEATNRLSPEYRDMLQSSQEICDRIRNNAKHDAACLIEMTNAQLHKSKNEVERNRREAEIYHRQYCSDTQAYGARLKAVEKLVHRPTTSITLSWLAEQYAEFSDWSFREVEQKLEWWNHAYKASEIVSMVRKEHRQAIKELRVHKARSRYYERMFPFLCDVAGDEATLIPQESIDGISSSQAELADPVCRWLKEHEYRTQSETERNQLALDRYVKRRKTNWELGRDYEAYIGHTYSKAGYAVEYVGMKAGLEDLGRDLICRSEMTTLVVQCKRWAQSKLIHEKHVNQLVGTTIEYAQKYGGTVKLGQYSLRFGNDLFDHTILPVLVTTTHLSETAKQFAKCLGVEARESIEMGEYPMIKCNVSRQDGRKIYHLPFDEQYDNTVIEPERGECFTFTIQEAIDMGFVRAKRHFPRSRGSL